MKHATSTSHQRRTARPIINDKIEALMKEFLTRLTEASYQVALKFGFQGTFINFLSDLQDALEQVIHKDRSHLHGGRKVAQVVKRAMVH